MAIVRSTGFARVRRGLFEHVAQGRITAIECFLYLSMISNADPASGIWEGSAGLLSAFFSIPERTCRDCLEKLESKGYLKRFPTRGKHGSYPILIHKFECSQGAVNGKRLNALETMFSGKPVYYSCDDSVIEDGDDGVNDGAAKYKRQETRDSKRLSRKSRGRDFERDDSDPRHAACRNAIADYYRKANGGDDPDWSGREAKALKNFLDANPKLTEVGIVRLLEHRAQSQVNHADRPSKWIESLSSYRNGPINAYGRPAAPLPEPKPKLTFIREDGTLVGAQ